MHLSGWSSSHCLTAVTLSNNKFLTTKCRLDIIFVTVYNFLRLQTLNWQVFKRIHQASSYREGASHLIVASCRNKRSYLNTNKFSCLTKYWNSKKIMHNKNMLPWRKTISTRELIDSHSRRMFSLEFLVKMFLVLSYVHSTLPKRLDLHP